MPKTSRLLSGKLFIMVAILFMAVFLVGRAQPVAGQEETPTPEAPLISCEMVDQIPLSECNALFTFYDSTSGAVWRNNTNWLTTDAPCTDWFGVSCGGGSVIRLNLSNNDLVGEIPVELAALTNLITVSLGSNDLQGQIPPELGTLASLQELRLENNSLIGNLPVEITSLVNLTTLALNGNDLTGPILPEFGNLTNLNTLTLSCLLYTSPSPRD